MIKVVVFDFDGTVVDSNEIKWDSYFNLFPSSSDKVKEIITGIDRVGGTRWEIVRKILVALKKAGEIDFTDLEDEVKKKGEQYSEIVEKRIIESQGIPGAFESIGQLFKKYPVYLNSGTPHEPFVKTVVKIIESGKLSSLTGILGRREGASEMAAKIFNLQLIMSLERATSDEIVFIGDREIDRKAAEEVVCHFIGLENKASGWLKRDFLVVNDLKNLPAFIAQLK